MDLNRMGEILDMLAEELPEEFYKDLNAGIVLTPEIKRSPYGDDMVIMGEYVRSNLGRGIVIYGGSINSVYGWMPEEDYKAFMERAGKIAVFFDRVRPFPYASCPGGLLLIYSLTA